MSSSRKITANTESARITRKIDCTTAVVQSIFLVILADSLFAVLFLELDI
jgi:ABC-type transporter Mla maintaining outer membrane lipid asymmetry permease subunit MlaE